MVQANTSVLRRLAAGFGANVYGQITTVFIQVAGVPIMLYAWGVDLYGSWLILFAIPAYLSIIDLGFSLSAANDMTAKVERKNFDGAALVFESLFGLVLASSVVFFILFSFIAIAIIDLNFFSARHIANQDARYILLLLFGAVVFRVFDGINHAGFRANGDYGLHKVAATTCMLLQHSMMWGIALVGGDPVLAAATFFLVQLAGTLLNAVFLVRRHTWLKYSLSNANWRVMVPLIKPALANVAIPLAQAMNIQGMIIVVGSMISPAAVVVFSTSRTLTRLATQMVLATSHAFEPELARAWGKEDRAFVKSLFLAGFALAFWLNLFAVTFLFIFGQLILETWTSGQVPMNEALFYLFLISSFLSVIWYSALNVMKAANLHLPSAVFYIVGATLSVVLSALLLYHSRLLPLAALPLVFMDLFVAVFVMKHAIRATTCSVSDVLRSTFSVPLHLLTSRRGSN